MATTRIMPLHIGKGRTESRAISDIIDYVANPQKTDNGKLITGYGCDSRTADAEFLLAKRQYIAATGRVRGADDVIAYHVRQSFKPGEITPEEANRLGVEFAKRFTKGNQACRLIPGNHGPQLGNRAILGTELVYQGADHYHGYEVRHIADGLNTFLKKFPSHLIQKQSENNGKRKSNQQIQKADQKSVF